MSYMYELYWSIIHWNQKHNTIKRAKMEKKYRIRRWFVLLCAHISLVIFGGTYRSFGVLLVEWTDYFDASSTQISAIMSVLAASGLLSGIPSGIVITKYGCHCGSLLGAIAFVTGTLLSVFAPNPIVLCFTTGFLTGLGVGAVRNSALVAVAHVFKKGFSRANGVAIAGTSVGIMLMPPLLQLCIDQYGWRGALLILVGIQLHLFVAALIFRLPEGPVEAKTKPEEQASVDRNKSDEAEFLKDDAEEIEMTVAKSGVQQQSSTNEQDAKEQSEQDVSKFVDELSKSSEQIKERLSNVNESNSSGSEPDETNDHPQQSKEILASDSLLKQETDGKTVDRSDVDRKVPSESSRHFSRLKTGLDSSGLSLFCDNVGFCLFTLCQIMIGLCYTGILTHLVASAVYDGITEQSASFLLSAFGISSLIIRLVNGWLVDLQLLSPEHLYVLSMVVFGAAMILSRAWSAYGWYVVVAIFFGLSSGLFKALNPVVLKRFVGMEYFARAVGVFYVFCAAGDLIGPVFTGALYDAKKSYDLPFYVGGSVLIISSGLLLLEPPLRRLKERRQVKAEEGRDLNEEAV